MNNSNCLPHRTPSARPAKPTTEHMETADEANHHRPFSRTSVLSVISVVPSPLTPRRRNPEAIASIKGTCAPGPG